MKSCILYFVLVIVYISSVQSQNTTCPEIRGRCTECINTPGCSYCASTSASGCFDALYASNCQLIGGSLNNCTVANDTTKSTQCVSHESCQDCKNDSACDWCQSGTTGYCFAKTGGLVCGALSGSFVPVCGSNGPSPSTESGGPVDASNGVVDPKGSCQRFAANTCQGTVFYNVYENATNTQVQMEANAKSLLGFSNFPGVSAACREAATSLLCGTYFAECTPVTGTNYVVPIPPCRSLCDRTNEECRSVLEPFGRLLNCEEIDPSTHTYRYPVNTISYALPNGDTVNYQCNDMIPVGYYPNVLKNSGFENSVAGTISEWIVPTTVNLTSQTDVIGGRNTTVASMVSINGSNFIDNEKGLMQNVVLNSQEVRPIKFGGYSKAEGVDGEPGIHYALVLDVYYQDGTVWKNVSVEFNTSSHDYQFVEMEITPEKPVHNISFFVTFFNKTGKSYFDDLALQEKVPEKADGEPVCLEPYLAVNLKRNEPGQDQCVIACPAYAFDHPVMLDVIYYMQLVLAWISLILMTFLIATYLVFPQKRKYPSRLVIYFCFGAWVIAFRYCVQSWYTPEESICISRSEFLASETSSFCVFTGLFMTFGATTCLAWWSAVVINTYLMITNHMQQRSYLYLEKYFHIGAWTYVLLSCLVGALGSGYESGPASVGGCFIRKKDNSAWQLGIFYVPVGICLIFGTALLGRAMYVVYQITQTREAQNSSRKGNLKTYFRLIGFLMIVFVNFTFLFCYKFYTFDIEDPTTRRFSEYVVCKSTGNEDCGERPSFASVTLFFNQLCVSSEGIIIFLFFGTQSDNYQLWKDFLRNKKAFASLFSTFGGTVNGSRQSSNSKEARSGNDASKRDSVNMTSSVRETDVDVELVTVQDTNSNNIPPTQPNDSWKSAEPSGGYVENDEQ